MPSSSTTSSRNPDADAAFRAVFADARRERNRKVTVRPHRAFTPLRITPYLLAQAVLLPMLFSGLLWWGHPLVMDFWRDCILFWSGALNLPYAFSAVLDPSTAGGWRLQSTGQDIPMPTNVQLAGSVLLVAAASAGSDLLRGRALPFRYPVRIMCVVQTVTIAYFWFAPGRFPYGIARHSEELMTIGYLLMVAAPLMLAVGYYILNVGVVTKIVRTVLILAFLGIMIPHQVLMQALVLQQMSTLYMPLLYICFGAVFEALVFVALYSWAAGDTGEEATR